MHVRNTSDRYACLELGILVKSVFTKILLLDCLLEHGLIIQNQLLACLFETWFNNSKLLFSYLLFEIWFFNLKSFLACLLFEIWFFNLKPFACLLFKSMVE